MLFTVRQCFTGGGAYWAISLRMALLETFDVDQPGELGFLDFHAIVDAAAFRGHAALAATEAALTGLRGTRWLQAQIPHLSCALVRHRPAQ